jgi:hypothetical protein
MVASDEERIIVMQHGCKETMMNPGTTLIKTDKGKAEIAERSHALNAVQRRLLILIDGKKTVNDLGAFARVGELDAALDHLQREELIESADYIAPLQAPVAPCFAAGSPSEAPRPATSPEEFKKVRQQASDFVLERLGSDGEPICAAIDRCDSPAALRKLLRGVEIFIGQRLSAETTQAFARHFGSLLL